MLRVKSTHPESQGAFVEIEDEDFDDEVHELYVEHDPDAPAKSMSKAELVAKLAELGVAADMSWNKAALQDALQDATK